MRPETLIAGSIPVWRSLLSSGVLDRYVTGVRTDLISHFLPTSCRDIPHINHTHTHLSSLLLQTLTLFFSITFIIVNLFFTVLPLFDRFIKLLIHLKYSCGRAGKVGVTPTNLKHLIYYLFIMLCIADTHFHRYTDSQ